MNRDQRDWPAVRTAVQARMTALGLSPAQVARTMRASENTVRAFLDGRTRPQGATIYSLNKALGLPYDHLNAIADSREPEPEPGPEPRERVTGSPTPEPVAALLSLADLGPGAHMVTEYKAYVSMVAKELRAAMTREQRSDVGTFLHDISCAVRWG